MCIYVVIDEYRLVGPRALPPSPLTPARIAFMARSLRCATEKHHFYPAHSR